MAVRSSRSSLASWWAAVLALGLMLGSGNALARSGGLAASGCLGCHNGGVVGTLSMTANPPTFTPGDRVELTLSLVGGYKNGGVFLTTSPAVGELQPIANTGLSKVSGGLVHNQPKPSSNGSVQFKFAWVAPAQPGAVRFSAYALGGDANARSSGDAALEGNFDFVYGCTGATYFLDGDSDGVGRMDLSVLGCTGAPPPGYVAESGDCDDYRKTVYPGAKELCNMLDDNCDGQIDENAVPVELWPDADGDGYYDVRTEKVGTPKVGCAGLKDWAAEPGDCQPKNKAIHPGAVETCNSLDDDCDGDADERVRPTCGEGWCRRESAGCDPMYCTPGAPVAEKCNFLDDDCDGDVDEDPDMCPQGQTCAAGTCLDSSQVALDPDGKPTPIGGSSNVSGSGSGSSGQAGAGGGAQSLDSGDSSGCALGPASRHSALAALALLISSAALRRKRQR